MTGFYDRYTRCLTCGGIMADCNRAMIAQKDAGVEDWLACKELPDGLRVVDNVVSFDCSRCGATTEWHGEPGEFTLGDPNNLCGGSPRCCP